MGLFRKGSAAARLQAELDNLRVRRVDLAAQLDDAKAASASNTEGLHAALIGDASRDDISQLETQLANTDRRASALASALGALDTKIADTQARLDADERHRVAQEEVDALDVTHAEFIAKLDAFAKAAADLAPISEKLSKKAFSAKRLAAVAQAAAIEFPRAKAGIADEVRWTRAMILQKAEPASAERAA